MSGIIECPDCLHEIVVKELISDDDTFKCDACKGMITITLEFEPEEEEQQEEAGA